MIKAVCFDLDGVYFTPESFKRFRLALAKNTSEEKAIEVLNKSQQMQDFKKGLLTENEYWDYARSELQLTYSNEEIFKILRDSYEVNPEVASLVNKVKALGIKACICSNNFPTRIRELDMKFSFLKDFDVVVLSYQVGLLKPSWQIFQELINKSEVHPGQIAYSDDSPEKLTGALELHINAFVFENIDQFVTKLRDLGVAI